MENFSHLPEELRRTIVSQITDLTDILTLEEISPQYNAYAREIIRLTTRKFMTIPLTRLFKYPHLRYIDHQIAVKFSHLASDWIIISRVKQAHLVINDWDIFKLLINDLATDGYYKISLVINENLYGVFITKNSAFVLYKYFDDGSTSHSINQILLDAHFTIKGRQYRGNPSPNKRKFISQSMRDLLKFTDFGLMDPLQLPSATNLPLREYTKLLSNNARLTYVLYNYLSDIYRYYSGNYLPQYRNELPDTDTWLTIQNIAEYKPIISLSNDKLTTIQRIITVTFFKYTRIPPGDQIYKSDGSVGIRFK